MLHPSVLGGEFSKILGFNFGGSIFRSILCAVPGSGEGSVDDDDGLSSMRLGCCGGAIAVPPVDEHPVIQHATANPETQSNVRLLFIAVFMTEFLAE